MSGRLTFRPPLWATLLLLAACALFATAGFWQLDRKAQKEGLLNEFARGNAADPLLAPPADAAAVRYRPLRLRGSYDAGRQVLLDNIVRDGQAGYLVLTPLRTSGGVILVNRGWLVADPDRSRLPDISVGDGERDVVGLIDRLPRPGLRVQNVAPAVTAPWPRRLVFPTAGEIAAQLGYPVADFQVLLDPEAADGYVRDWRPAVSGPETHLGYAVQWFAFAAAATAIYIALNLKRHA